MINFNLLIESIVICCISIIAWMSLLYIGVVIIKFLKYVVGKH